MKIEKINDNQIRCTLTREDLESHQIRISELAYGTDKAKKLFRDMMQQAQIQFGFEADNIPLMIEAIPVSTESHPDHYQSGGSRGTGYTFFQIFSF